MDFLHSSFTNAYTNVTNVLLVLTPATAKQDMPAVLLNAHFDSTLGSPGLYSLDSLSQLTVSFRAPRLLLVSFNTA